MEGTEEVYITIETEGAYVSSQKFQQIKDVLYSYITVILLCVVK